MTTNSVQPQQQQRIQQARQRARSLPSTPGKSGSSCKPSGISTPPSITETDTKELAKDCSLCELMIQNRLAHDNNIQTLGVLLDRVCMTSDERNESIVSVMEFINQYLIDKDGDAKKMDSSAIERHLKQQHQLNENRKTCPLCAMTGLDDADFTKSLITMTAVQRKKVLQTLQTSLSKFGCSSSVVQWHYNVHVASPEKS
jgi:hypothetical protein